MQDSYGAESIKRDCILLHNNTGYKSCAGLKEIYCRWETCNFYKSVEEYNRDGTPKEVKK